MTASFRSLVVSVEETRAALFYDASGPVALKSVRHARLIPLCQDRGVEQTRTVTVDAGLPARLAGAHLRRQLRRGWWIALAVTAGILTLLVGALAALTGDAALLPWVALLIVLVVAIPALSYAIVRRAMRRGFPPGSEISAEVGDDTLLVASALGSSEIRYAAFRRVDVTATALILQLRASGTALLPRSLFDDTDLDRLQQRVAAARVEPRA